MARMPDNLIIKVIAEPVVQMCKSISGDHNFEPARTSGSWMLLFCDQCGMMISTRFEDASGS